MTINWLFAPTLALSWFFFLLGWKVVCRGGGRRKGIVVLLTFVAGIPGFLMPLYYLHFFDQALWFYEFRALPFSELTASGAGFFAGALSGLLRHKRHLSRPLFLTVLSIGILVPYIKPVLAPLAETQFAERWVDDVCLQSTQATCGAASAATILRSFGIAATEKEIARACYSYQGGTENWYLSRFLRQKNLHVRYVQSEGGLARIQLPAIAGVRLGQIGHFIPVLSETVNGYVAGDPLDGKREIRREEIHTTYQFTGFFMEIGEREGGIERE